MIQQQSCRNLYYAWCKYFEMDPQKYLCIIHDKMDQKKTVILRLRVRSKDTDFAWQLQVSLIGMITYGHGHGHYGHFTLNEFSILVDWMTSQPKYELGRALLRQRSLDSSTRMCMDLQQFHHVLGYCSMLLDCSAVSVDCYNMIQSLLGYNSLKMQDLDYK